VDLLPAAAGVGAEAEVGVGGSNGRGDEGDETVKIEVVENQIEAALKQLKKQMLKDGVFQEMKRRAYYEKPSVKRKRKQALARKKRRRAARRFRGDDD
jgi:small subunit ribosomal protein S21